MVCSKVLADTEEIRQGRDGIDRVGKMLSNAKTLMSPWLMH